MADKDDALTTWNRRSPIDDIVEQLDDLEIANVYDYYERMYFDYISLDEAIEIVKGGAVDDETMA